MLADLTLRAVEDAVMESRDDEDRWHLGASLIGRDCSRQLFYIHRWAFDDEPEPRMVRLWARGDREEDVFVALLRDAGLIVLDRDPESGKQFRVSDHHGHFGGSLDAMIYGLPEFPTEWALGEFKTHNDKSFKTLKAEGVRSAKLEHWVQMQIYMRKRGIARGLYCAVNKNDDTLHFEIVECEPAEADKYIVRAGNIIFNDTPPLRISPDPSWYQCSYCAAKPICHGKATPRVNCRTCAHITPVEGGMWHCGFHNIVFSKPTNDEPSPMLKGCGAHVFNPHLLNGVAYLGGDRAANYTLLKLPNGDTIKQGPRHVRSIDLKLV